MTLDEIKRSSKEGNFQRGFRHGQTFPQNDLESKTKFGVCDVEEVRGEKFPLAWVEGRGEISGKI